jgi:hypothetical protein
VIHAGEIGNGSIPNFGSNLKNEWDLTLGPSLMNLSLEAGAYKGRIDLGGLALKSLSVQDGAADSSLNFSKPNLTEMGQLLYQTGASKIELSGLANANFTSMTFHGGAGDYSLDFSGQLKRDANVMLELGLSKLTVVVPQGVSTRVTFEGGLTNIRTNGSWIKSGSDYILEGSGPTLTIHLNMGAGDVNLETN